MTPLKKKKKFLFFHVGCYKKNIAGEKKLVIQLMKEEKRYFSSTLTYMQCLKNAVFVSIRCLVSPIKILGGKKKILQNLTFCFHHSTSKKKTKEVLPYLFSLALSASERLDPWLGQSL